MNRRMAWTPALLFAVWLSSTWALAATGPEVAQLLNKRYQNTLTECAGGRAAYFCSGVMLRGSELPTEFWKHGDVATQLGAESVVYLRADVGTNTLSSAYGIVFSDAFTAISQGKTLEALCAYPFPLTLDANRPEFGCGLVASRQEVSSCAGPGVSDAPGWLAHFEQQSREPARQCSLSAQVPAQFKASLLAHQGIDAEWSAKATQVQIKNWDTSAPKQLPIEALFYDVLQTGALLGAQKDQRDYFTATGDWLPILRMDLSQHPEAVFGFHQGDQLYIGYQVAARLNTRYTDTASTCLGGKAAFYCNGVLLRGTQASTAFHMWNPSPVSQGNKGVSFSYLRKDAGLTRLLVQQGFIVRESFAPAATPMNVRCGFPFDGNSAYPVPDVCRVRGPMCDELGITTVQAWADRYATNPRSSCAFNIDPEQFQLNIDVRPSVTNGDSWNEVIIETWPQDIPSQIPLEVFYYSHASNGLSQAQFGQRDYFQTTGRFLPIVQVNLEAADGQVFSYEPSEQNSPGAPANTLLAPEYE
ncbi:hypothetical protein [Pseudomonas sp. WC2]|uniref:hypothetical protein n=1 Tax=Pseudomonas sp. WC2 TaxID=3424773 RepID=UPI003D33F578